jgi:hypothetical protein|tara:strand:+ start:311 stop:475 length:165 start_codon:yes stop_codon:yes gene_type:complete
VLIFNSARQFFTIIVALNEINIYARDVLYQLMGENIEVNMYKVFKKATRSWAWC